MTQALSSFDTFDLKAFLDKAGIRYQESVKLSALTKMAIGGNCPFLIEPDNEAQLLSLISELRRESVDFRILGAGSNLLIDDTGISEPVIKLGKGFRYEKFLSETEVEVGGAMPLMQFARKVSERGLSGLEFAGGIPASIGGAVRMNAGAHGGEMSKLISSVTYIDPEEGLKTVDASEITFEYRKTSIPKDAVITKVILKFSKTDPKQCTELIRANLEARKAAQPLTLPSSGSIFKNPSTDNTAGKLLERCGMKGVKKGGASVSTMHANWIVNEGKDAKAREVLELIEECQKAALEKEGIELTPELVTWLK
ncbi:MAG: UDP-N-acetylmuramate dehydrogenase [Bdellovibrionota bacterium]